MSYDKLLIQVYCKSKFFKLLIKARISTMAIISGGLNSNSFLRAINFSKLIE